MNKITIGGVKCIISSSVHQSTGDIFFRKDAGDSTHYIDEMFTKDEAIKVMHYLKLKNWHPRCSDSTYFGGWGHRVSLISIYMSEDDIQEAFVSYFKKTTK